MIIKNTLLTLIAIVLCNQLMAQAPSRASIQISGTVVDTDSGEPLEYATLVLQSVKNPEKVTGGITDENGKFNVETSPGAYHIRVEYISYTTYTLRNQMLRSNTDLGKVELGIDVAQLNEVVVRGEKTQVEIRLDKKIYNVGKDITALGGSVTDVLDNVPSVSVDVEGNVSLRGNDNVRILINGKPSALVGISGTDALRQLPADAIEKVEVITSPSARYDAEGTAGILNIILKRSKLAGFNGSITANVGSPLSAGLSTSLNFRTDKINLFTTTGYSYRDVPGNSFFAGEFFESNTSSEETRTFDRTRKSFNTNIGLEYFINNSASITGSFLYRTGDNNSDTNNNTLSFDSDKTLTNITHRLDPEIETRKTVQYSLNYDKKFNDKGEKLTVNFQIEDSEEDENSLIIDTKVFPVGDVKRESVATLEKEDRILLQSDYVLPIGENSQFEIGYRGVFKDLITDYAVEMENHANILVNDPDLTNVLNYKEYINAIYTQYGSKIGEKFSYLLGLRFEDSNIRINQITSGKYVNKKYSNFFPTVNLAYELNERDNITLGFNKRIRRPRSRFINPFPSRSSPTNQFQGNPDIDPSISTTFDLGYLKRWKKVTLSSSIYYQHATDVFSFIREETGEVVTISGEEGDPNPVEIPVIRSKPINLATNDRYGFEFTLNYNPSRKWRMNTNFNFFNSITEGDYEGQNFDAENTSWFVRFNNTYTLPGKVNWQTRLMYRGPSENAQSTTEGLFSANLAFSKDIFKEKGSLALSVNDVLNSRKRKSESSTENTKIYSEFQWRERSISLTFTYRFNQKKNQRNRNQRNGNGGEDFEFQG